MSKQSLHRYTCDGCGEVLISEKVPRGWVRILSQQQRTSGGRLDHHTPPALWTPTKSKAFPEDGHWCSPDCIASAVKKAAEELIEMAKVGR